MAGTSETNPRAYRFRRCACCVPTSSRRDFLAGLGAFGAAAILPRLEAHGQGKSALIDTHLHFYPPEYQKLWLGYEDARKQPHFPGQVVDVGHRCDPEGDRIRLRHAEG